MKRIEIVCSGNMIHRRAPGSPSALCGFVPPYKRMRWVMYASLRGLPTGKFNACQPCLDAMPERR